MKLFFFLGILTLFSVGAAGDSKQKGKVPEPKESYHLGRAVNWSVPAKWKGWRPGKPLDLRPFPEKPFWRDKKKVHKQLSEERRIVVSVTKEVDRKKSPPNLLKMKGVGHFNVTRKRAFSYCKNFENLKKIGFFVRNIEFDKNRHTLYLHAEAYNYHAYMLMLVNFIDSKEKDFNEIQFQVVKGVFAGMSGRLRFVDEGRRKSEVSIVADYEYDKLNIPEFFVNFGLEVVLHRVAGRLRELIEDSTAKKPGKGRK